MSDFIKPYNDDPFVGNLATPISTSSFTRNLLSNLPAYRVGLSPLLRGLEIGITHGYFQVEPCRGRCFVLVFRDAWHSIPKHFF